MTTTRRRGLTIVEILVTLVIIGIMFTSIFGLVQSQTKRVYWGGDETMATIYASDIIEVIRGAPYDAFFWKEPELNMTLTDIFQKHPIPQGEDLKKYDPRFTILADVTAAGDLSPPALKRVKVTISWMPKDSKVKRDLRLVTFYGPPR